MKKTKKKLQGLTQVIVLGLRHMYTLILWTRAYTHIEYILFRSPLGCSLS